MPFLALRNRIIFGLKVVASQPATLAIILAVIYLEYCSLYWTYHHDTPLMIYIGLAMERFGLVPYRDIVDMNPPGTHLFHWFLVKVAGTSHLGVRLFDLVWLSATQVAIVAFMRRYGWSVAIAAAGFYTLQIYRGGSGNAVQREYFCALPLLVALFLAFRSTRSLWSRLFGIGLCHGLIAVIKPPLAISLPFLLLALAGDSRHFFHRWRSFRQRAVVLTTAGSAVLTGLALAPLLCWLYLTTNGGWQPFAEIWRHYWPLYAELRGNGSVREDFWESARFWEVVRLARNYGFIGISGIGMVLLAGQWSTHRRDFLVLASLWLAFLVYIFVSGKFWMYHGYPLYLVASMCAGLALLREDGVYPYQTIHFARQCIVLILGFHAWYQPEGYTLALEHTPVPLRTEIEEAAAFLTAHMAPTDEVQPLDVAGGAVHAMLLAKAKLATPYLYDFYFYHHPDHPYILQQKQRFLAALHDKRPRWMITTRRPVWRTVGHQAGEFPELNAHLTACYVKTWQGGNLLIFERLDHVCP